MNRQEISQNARLDRKAEQKPVCQYVLKFWAAFEQLVTNRGKAVGYHSATEARNQTWQEPPKNKGWKANVRPRLDPNQYFNSPDAPSQNTSGGAG